MSALRAPGGRRGFADAAGIRLAVDVVRGAGGCGSLSERCGCGHRRLDRGGGFCRPDRGSREDPSGHEGGREEGSGDN